MQDQIEKLLDAYRQTGNIKFLQQAKRLTDAGQMIHATVQREDVFPKEEQHKRGR